MTQELHRIVCYGIITDSVHRYAPMYAMPYYEYYSLEEELFHECCF